MSNATPQNLDTRAALACVERSPRAVAAQDKAAWLALFSPDAVVEDPVGSRPWRHQPEAGERGSLPRFYEAFIAGNEISFLVAHDVVQDGCVFRDLDMEIRLAGRFLVRVPMHLRYELVCTGDGLRVRRLAAHWELMPMLRQQMGAGPAGLRAGAAAGWRLWRHLGLSGLTGFGRAMRGVGERGKITLLRCLAALQTGDTAIMRDCCSVDARLDWPGMGELSLVDKLPSGLPALRATKLIAAGDTVTATVYIPQGANEKRGILLAEFAEGRRRIHTMRMFI